MLPLEVSLLVEGWGVWAVGRSLHIPSEDPAMTATAIYGTFILHYFLLSSLF
jgi:hypothetical protein